MTAPISNGPTTTRLHHYAGHYYTTAHPQQGNAETDDTSAPENCAKNTHFAPAKAMTVSVKARPAPAKAMAVSDSRPT